MIEIFKDIPGYEGLYQVSNLGNVKSLNYKHTGIKIILKPQNNKGYLAVNLYKNKKRKMFFVHRLVAETFIPNPDNLPQVQHLDENKQNNFIDNLCWCSVKENINWGTRNKRVQEKLGIKIKCFDLQTSETTHYLSIIEASRQLKIRRNSIQYSLYKSKRPYKNRYIFSEVS